MSSSQQMKKVLYEVSEADRRYLRERHPHNSQNLERMINDGSVRTVNEVKS